MNRLIIAIVAVVIAAYVLFSSLFIVNEREQAIVMRFGEITREIQDPGIYFKVPTDFVETVQYIDKRLLRYDLERIRLQVSGGQFYIVDAFITYRIVDPIRFRQTVLGSLQLDEQSIATRLESALRAVYGLREFDAALSEQRSEMMREASDLVATDMTELGIEVVDVRVLVTDLTPEVSQQTYERMQAERNAEAALIRARGQEQAQTLRAIADRQAVEVVSAANRDSEIIRGEGDAEQNRLFAEAYSQDLLRVLPLDGGLSQRAGRWKHHHGALAGLGVLQLFRFERRIARLPGTDGDADRYRGSRTERRAHRFHRDRRSAGNGFAGFGRRRRKHRAGCSGSRATARDREPGQ